MHIVWNASVYRATYHMIPTMWHSRNGKTMEKVKRSVVTGGWVERKVGMNQSILNSHGMSKDPKKPTKYWKGKQRVPALPKLKIYYKARVIKVV